MYKFEIDVYMGADFPQCKLKEFLDQEYGVKTDMIELKGGDIIAVITVVAASITILDKLYKWLKQPENKNIKTTIKTESYKKFDFERNTLKEIKREIEISE